MPCSRILEIPKGSTRNKLGLKLYNRRRTLPLYRPRTCCEVGGPFAGAEILSSTSTPSPFLMALTDVCRKHQVSWQEFANLADVDMVILQRWRDGAVPPRRDFDSLVHQMGKTAPFSRDDIRQLIGGYYRSARRRSSSRNSDVYKTALLEAGYRMALNQPRTESLPQDRTPFSLVLEQVQVELGVSFREFAQMIDVTERTLRTWIEGKIPSRQSFEKLIKQALSSGRVSKETSDFLLLTYRNSGGIGPYSDQIKIYEGDIVDSLQHILNEKPLDGPPPAVPRQTSPGPTLKPTDAGFDIAQQPPPESERDDPELQRLHQQLRRLAERLAASMPRISNTHYAQDAAKWNLVGWIFRDAPTQRLRPMVASMPGADFIARKTEILNIVRLFASTVFPTPEKWTWAVISEVIIDRLERVVDLCC